MFRQPEEDYQSIIETLQIKILPTTVKSKIYRQRCIAAMYTDSELTLQKDNRFVLKLQDSKLTQQHYKHIQWKFELTYQNILSLT